MNEGKVDSNQFQDILFIAMNKNLNVMTQTD
jgi:hypothetical protein